MNAPAIVAPQERERNLLFLATPVLWVVYPFLPLIRRHPNGSEDDLGMLVDAKGIDGRYGLSCTVYLGNIFDLPKSLPEFYELPRETFDNPEEIYDAGWRVD